VVIGLTEKREQRIRAVFEEKGPILRSKQLREHKVDSQSVQALLAQGKLIRLKEGYYVWQDQADLLTDAQIATGVIPGATLFYLSAAVHYGLTTLIPERVYVAVPNRGLEPKKPDYPPVEISRLSHRLYLLGRTATDEGHYLLPVYDREKTVCDIAKRMDAVGKDVLIEVIRSYLNGPKNLQKLYHYANIMRVQKRIHPYIEAIV